MSAAVSKVIYNSNVLIDLTEDTVSPDKLLEGITAHDAAGNPITGTLVSTDTTDATASASDIAKGKTAYVNGEKITGSITVFNGIRITARNATIAKPTDASDSEGNKLISNSLSLGTDYLIRAGKYTIQLFAEAYGDAQPEDVAAGKTFTSAAGAIVTGTKTESTPNLTTGSATPSKAAQTFTPDGYDGYSAFTVAAIPDEYIVPSGTKEITANGTVDVTEYAKVTVAVPTSGDNTLLRDVINGYVTEIQHDTVERIGMYALQYRTSLTAVVFPAVRSIGASAFYYCKALVTADFHLATSIGSLAFGYCHSFTTLILRKNVVCTLSASSVFLKAYHFSGTTDSTYNPNGLKDGYIYVPSALVDSYKAATNWSTYASQIRALEDYTVDGTTTGALDESKI